MTRTLGHLPSPQPTIHAASGGVGTAGGQEAVPSARGCELPPPPGRDGAIGLFPTPTERKRAIPLLTQWGLSEVPRPNMCDSFASVPTVCRLRDKLTVVAEEEEQGRGDGRSVGAVGWCPQDGPAEGSGGEGLECSGRAGEADTGLWGDSGISAQGRRFTGAAGCPVRVRAVRDEGQAEDPGNAPSSGADGRQGPCQGTSRAQGIRGRAEMKYVDDEAKAESF